MDEWLISARDLKGYPHFDKHLSLAEANAIVASPERVKTNKFYPFLLYKKHWRPFRLNGKDPKERLIRYAARRDAYIFMRYRRLLNAPYEATLCALGLGDCVLAYRKIAVSEGTNRGKCNIHFARDAFDKVAEYGNCCTVALDISKFFESLDHARLRELWCRMLSTRFLPPDHATVFRNITSYAYVAREQVYERLGIVISQMTKSGRPRRDYTISHNKMPAQLCSPELFRERVAGGASNLPSLIQKNQDRWGIPQGAPISDLLAKLYLIDFDTAMSRYARDAGGVYCRYSDDILLILPGDASVGLAARDSAMAEITRHGAQLKIKPEKTSIVVYGRSLSGELRHEHVDGVQGKNGLEYLGFRFDGKRVYLRDSTVSGFYRKISVAARHAARKHVARYQGKDLAWLIEHFDFEGFTSRFGRVEEFDDDGDYKNWTFWTYARRASEAFGPQGQPILRQINGYREQIRSRVERALVRAVSGSSP